MPSHTSNVSRLAHWQSNPSRPGPLAALLGLAWLLWPGPVAERGLKGPSQIRSRQNPRSTRRRTSTLSPTPANHHLYNHPNTSREMQPSPKPLFFPLLLDFRWRISSSAIVIVAVAGIRRKEGMKHPRPIRLLSRFTPFSVDPLPAGFHQGIAGYRAETTAPLFRPFAGSPAKASCNLCGFTVDHRPPTTEVEI